MAFADAAAALIVLAALNLSGPAAAFRGGTTPIPSVDVFTPGELGYPCIRIPSLLLAGDGKTLLAFAECRNYTGDGCVPQVHHGLQLASKMAPAAPENSNKDICMKSSADGGGTWSALHVVERDAGQPTAVVYTSAGSTARSLSRSSSDGGSAAPSDAASDVSLLVLNFNKQSTGGNFATTSTDNGLTWTTPQSLDASLGPNKSGADAGPGVGIQLSAANPVAPGRLLFIGHHGAYGHDVVWYSDDAVTYKASATLLEHMDEAQLVELADGSVMANMRNDHYNKTCDCRGIAISKDGGATFGPISYDPQLISPVCMASIVREPTTGDLFFANPASTSGRENGVVKRSTDQGASWSAQYPVSGATGPYAYSCLSLHPTAGMLGLLWETSMPSGCSGPSCRSVFSTIPQNF